MPNRALWENVITNTFTRGDVVVLNSYITKGREAERHLQAYLTPAEARAKAADLIKAAEEAESWKAK